MNYLENVGLTIALSLTSTSSTQLSGVLCCSQRFVKVANRFRSYREDRFYYGIAPVGYIFAVARSMISRQVEGNCGSWV